MRITNVWRWTTGVGALYTLVGAVFVVASFNDAALAWLNALLVPDRAPLTQSVRLYAAVMGAVVIGLGVMIARVAASIERGPAAVGRALRDALLVWFVVDTSASLLHGSWQNALFNVSSIAVGMPPILLALRAYRGAPRGREG